MLRERDFIDGSVKICRCWVFRLPYPVLDCRGGLPRQRAREGPGADADVGGT